MPFTLTMPKLSPTMDEGSIVKWHKKVGEKVEAGDLLMEVATDKATVEYNAIDEGWLRAILIKEGGEAKVNQPVAIFTAKKEESIEGYKPEGEMPAAPKPAVKEEVAVSAAAPASKAAVGMSQPAFVPEAPLANYEFEAVTETAGLRVLSSPLARKIAKEKGLDVSTVKGTGPHHRVMSRDLDKAQPAGTVAFGHRELPELPPGTYEEEQLTPMRKIVGQRLQESKTFIPHFYVSQDINALPMSELREQLKSYGVKVSFNDFIVRATALALRKHPIINSGFNSVTQSIIRFKTIDISIAVSLEGGLITPIVRHADYKNLGEIGVEVKSLAHKAREGKLQPHEYKGGSFTVSNLGMFGVSSFVAVINPPQASILAVSGIQERPVVKEGAVVPGKVISLTLSSDHRVVDGVDAAQFLQTLKQYLENPAGLLV